MLKKLYAILSIVIVIVMCTSCASVNELLGRTISEKKVESYLTDSLDAIAYLFAYETDKADKTGLDSDIKVRIAATTFNTRTKNKVTDEHSYVIMGAELDEEVKNLFTDSNIDGFESSDYVSRDENGNYHLPIGDWGDTEPTFKITEGVYGLIGSEPTTVTVNYTFKYVGEETYMKDTYDYEVKYTLVGDKSSPYSFKITDLTAKNLLTNNTVAEVETSAEEMKEEVKAEDTNSNEIADKVIYGKIYTSKDANELVEAVAIKGDKFIFVGSKADAEKYIGENTEVKSYDNGELITAGLTDGHTHVATMVIGKMNSLGNISQGADRETAVKDVTDYVNAHPEIDFYVLTGWEMQNFASEEYGCPTADMLDGITDKPILAYSSDGHSYWVNNALIKLAGVTKDTVPADGGEIVHDKDGNPLGVFKDTAQYVIDAVRPGKPKEAYESGIHGADGVCLNEGYVYRFQAYDNEASNSWKYPAITAMEELDKQGKLNAYTQSSFLINNTDDALDLVDEAIKLRDETKGGNFELTTVKIFLDGIIENSGAYLSQEYANKPGYYGTQRWKGEDAIVKMGHVIAKANKAGMSVHFHAMGDQATSDILTAIEYAADEVGIECVRENRNAIAHLALVKESDFERFANLNVISVFNPWCNKDPGYFDMQIELLGKDRAESQYPMQSFLKAGVHYSFGTDLGASFTYDSIECFHALTTRTYNNDDPKSLLNAKEKLSREETLKAMTIGGAYQLKKEDTFGSIEVGKDASLCIFSKDLLTIPDTEIMSTEVLDCMYKGQWREELVE